MTWYITVTYTLPIIYISHHKLHRCGRVVCRPANAKKIVKFWDVTTPKPLNQLIKSLAWVTKMAMTRHMPKFKTIATLEAWRRMHEYHSRLVFSFSILSYPILSYPFCDPQISLAFLD